MPIYLKPPVSGSSPGLLSRIVASIVAASLLVLAFVFGFAVFLVLLAVALVGGLIFSWKFRKVRKQMEDVMRQAATQNPAAGPGQTTQTASSERQSVQGDIFEGEFEVLNRED